MRLSSHYRTLDKSRSSKQLQPASMLADLTHFADDAHGALVSGMILGPVEGALLECCAAIDGRVAGRTDLKLGELVELDFYRIVGIALALRLSLLGL